jgi:hypothetical protein
MTDPGAAVAAEVYIYLYESLAEQQQVDRLSDDPEKVKDAAKAGYFAPIVRGAIDAELENPESRDAPYKLCCSACTGFLTRVGRLGI